MFNIDFPEALKKPLDLCYSNVTGVRGKEAEEILDSWALPFDLFMFVAQLVLSVPLLTIVCELVPTARFRPTDFADRPAHPRPTPAYRFLVSNL